MLSTKSISLPSLTIMNRGEVIGVLSRWKWPVAGVAAAFVGSLYTLGFSQVFQLYASDVEDKEIAGTSYGVKGLLKKLIHDFLQGGKNPENPPLSPNEASMIIRRYEKRVDVNCGIVSFYDTNNLPSNNPMEDRNTECRILNTNGALFSILDGHGGWQCAESVKTRLPIYIALALLRKSELRRSEKEILKEALVSSFYNNASTVNTEESSGLTTAFTLHKKQEIFHTGPKYLLQSLKEQLKTDKLPVDEALTLAYTQLDDDISAEAIPLKVLDDSFVVGATGACAVSAYIEEQDIYVANTGDCRVVLGSQKPDGSWAATALTADQNAKNESELKRILSEHPGEEGTVIRNERLLGQLQPLRAFGDIQYKWDRVTHSHILTQVYGGPIVPPNLYRSPPYLTAKPVITKHQLQGQDKFVILASDGLWDSLTNEQAVSLVGQFFNSRNKNKGEVIENNAATHLIRSAIGGNDHHFVAQMLLVPEQYRRMWRDDITVTVVFFKSADLQSHL
ncbi:hypothetical protein QZH41_017342 [Actinostola sp. cb2023]|nr:hypothetical protein QZH41_017342 [Actinostola sp. cb2023]